MFASVLPAQLADATHCGHVSLVSILAHCPKIVFGVLKVIFRYDPISGQNFSTSQVHIAFIASLEVLNVTHLGAD